MSLDPPLSDAQLLILAQLRTAARNMGGALPQSVTDAAPRSPTAVMRWPLRLSLPWSMLVSDNEKETAALRGSKPIKVITTKYKQGCARIAALAADTMGAQAPYDAPMQLRARVWVPDARPHDITNFCKGVHDSLEGVVYTNDRWLYSAHWDRAGVDVDAPRAEIAVSPVLQ